MASPNLQTYSSLIQGIRQWCNQSIDSTEFNMLIPTFIALTEQQLFMDMSTLGNLEKTYARFNKGDNKIIIPRNINWGRTLSLTLLNNPTQFTTQLLTPFITNNVVLERITLERMMDYMTNLPKGTTNTIPYEGVPKFYTDIYFQQIIVYPVPDQNYPYQLVTYQKITPLGNEASLQTNWNTTNNYDTLFYGCLAKAFAYLHNTDDSTFYDGLYKERVAAYLAYDKNRLVDRNINATGFNDVF